MIGLKDYVRDASVLSACGDGELAPPTPEELLSLLRSELQQPGSHAPASAHWVYARWKPRTSMTAGFRIDYEDGQSRWVTYKQYRGSKARAIAERAELSGEVQVADERLRAQAVLPATRACLWTFPSDRVLGGLGRLFDLRRTARMCAELGLFLPLRVRNGPSRITTLRYKPERRCVALLDLRLRPPGHGPRTQARIVARVMPPSAAARVAAARRSLPSFGLVPGLVAVQERTGIVLEEYLDLAVSSHPDASHAYRAGWALAQLHALPLPAVHSAGMAHVWPDARSLLAFEGSLGRAAVLNYAAPAVVPRCWVHGDFHADQAVRSRTHGGVRLLDLDQLAIGEPAVDLATWIADHLALDPKASFRDAGALLLEGYARGGGEAVDEERLARFVSAQLVQLAAGACRRLELGAMDKAQAMLERARDLAPGGVVP